MPPSYLLLREAKMADGIIDLECPECGKPLVATGKSDDAEVRCADGHVFGTVADVKAAMLKAAKASAVAQLKKSVRGRKSVKFSR